MVQAGSGAEPGEKIEALKLILTAVNYCLKVKLQNVLNLHHTHSVYYVMYCI